MTSVGIVRPQRATGRDPKGGQPGPQEGSPAAVEVDPLLGAPQKAEQRLLLGTEVGALPCRREPLLGQEEASPGFGTLDS